MSHPQPPWLYNSLQQSHLISVLRTLDFREIERESARIARPTSPPNSHSRSPSHPARPSNSAPDIRAHYSCSVGQDASHRRKNRYIALEPYNRTRVHVPGRGHLGHVEGEATDAPEPRYINANWVRESAGGKWWIAGQAPLPNTAHAFLTLGMSPVAPPSSTYHSTSSGNPPPSRRVHTIVQLTLMVEGGRRRAHPYFPGALRQNMVINPEHGCDLPPIHVFVESEEKFDDAQCIKTKLILRWGGAHNSSDSAGRRSDEWKVTHLLYTAWPDFGVPKENKSILRFARLVERVNNRHLSHPSSDPNASPPILVHCSAGVGRTGSFIALSSLLRAYSLLSSPRSPSRDPTLAPPLPESPLGPLRNLDHDLVAKEIDQLREQRQSMVQKEEQVVWVYEALADAFSGI